MVATNHGWIGVDFDGTLADYSAGWQGPEHCGAPIPLMVERVKRWLDEGREVRIFTARIWPINDLSADEDALVHLERVYERSTLIGVLPDQRRIDALKSAAAIRRWCQEHLGRTLRITNIKDLRMVELYDDRCVQVIADTGQLVGQSSRGIPA